MTENELRRLAEKEHKLSGVELENKITELKSLNCSILECIIYVRTNQECSLSIAKELVLNSLAWKEKKEEFINHQIEQMNEFLEAGKDDIKSIEQTFYSDKTDINITFTKKS